MGMILFSSIVLLALLSTSCYGALAIFRQFGSLSSSSSSSSSSKNTDATVMRQMMPMSSPMMMMSEEDDDTEDDHDDTMAMMSPPMSVMDMDMDMDMMMMSPMPSSMPMMQGGSEEEDNEEMMMMIPSMSPDEEDMMSMPSASPDDDDDEVCVDASYLTSKGFTHSTKHLVHRKHFQAEVLCPMTSGLPCGTRNHAVRLVGQKNTVSYGSYCEIYECERKTMLVNSVWSHVWNEDVHGLVSDNIKVKLTMFDQRHPQKLQMVLHRVMATVRQVIG